MEIEAIKKRLSDGLKIPENLLNGETAEELVSYAKAFIAFRKEQIPTRDTAADFLGLSLIEQEIAKNNIFQGEQTKTESTKTPGEIFAEWAEDKF